MNLEQHDMATKIQRKLKAVQIELDNWNGVIAKQKEFPVYASVGGADVHFDQMEFEGISSTCVCRLEARAKELQAEFDKL